jgi:hypothetical protein
MYIKRLICSLDTDMELPVLSLEEKDHVFSTD